MPQADAVETLELLYKFKLVFLAALVVLLPGLARVGRAKGCLQSVACECKSAGLTVVASASPSAAGEGAECSTLLAARRRNEAGCWLAASESLAPSRSSHSLVGVVLSRGLAASSSSCLPLSLTEAAPLKP